MGGSTDAPVAGGALVLTGPDWSVAPSRKEVLEVELPKTAAADFDAGTMLYHIFVTKSPVNFSGLVVFSVRNCLLFAAF